jgi:hypothetical protein
MKPLSSAIRSGKTLLIAFASWLLFAGLLFAKGETSGEGGGGGGSWILSYFLTGLAIVLGLLVVCRASSRRDRPRPEAYAEGKSEKGKD